MLHQNYYSKLLFFDSIEISYAFLVSKLFYERAKFSDCYLFFTSIPNFLWKIRTMRTYEPMLGFYEFNFGSRVMSYIWVFFFYFQNYLFAIRVNRSWKKWFWQNNYGWTLTFWDMYLQKSKITSYTAEYKLFAIVFCSRL